MTTFHNSFRQLRDNDSCEIFENSSCHLRQEDLEKENIAKSIKHNCLSNPKCLKRLAVILVGSVGAIRFSIAALILVKASDGHARLVSISFVAIGYKRIFKIKCYVIVNGELRITCVGILTDPGVGED
jgi:hypothetical protein